MNDKFFSLLEDAEIDEGAEGSGLDDKKRRACEYFVLSGNKEEAALKAGYSESYARKGAYKIFEGGGCRKYIRELREKVSSLVLSEEIAGKRELLIFYTQGMRGSLDNPHALPGKVYKNCLAEAEKWEQISFNEYGGAESEASYALNILELSKFIGIPFKERKACADSLAKFYQMFGDEVTVNVAEMDLSKIGAEELAEVLRVARN
jgi:hypothetical protein